MRYVVEVMARVDTDEASTDGMGHRVYESRTAAHELFFRCHIFAGVPYRAKNGAEVTVAAVRLYEAEAGDDDVAKGLVAIAGARLLNEVTTSELRSA
jgi:hypothetical protein